MAQVSAVAPVHGHAAAVSHEASNGVRQYRATAGRQISEQRIHTHRWLSNQLSLGMEIKQSDDQGLSSRSAASTGARSPASRRSTSARLASSRKSCMATGVRPSARTTASATPAVENGFCPVMRRLERSILRRLGHVHTLRWWVSHSRFDAAKTKA